MLHWWQLEGSSKSREVDGRLVGSGGHGDVEHVSVQQVVELQRSLWNLRAEHKRAVYLPSWGCAPSAEGWGRDSLALSLELPVSLGGRLPAPCGIPDRDSSAGGLWLLAATGSALKGSQGHCGTEGRWSQAAQGTSAGGGRLDPGTRALEESWV